MCVLRQLPQLKHKLQHNLPETFKETRTGFERLCLLIEAQTQASTDCTVEGDLVRSGRSLWQVPQQHEPSDPRCSPLTRTDGNVAICHVRCDLQLCHMPERADCTSPRSSLTSRSSLRNCTNPQLFFSPRWSDVVSGLCITVLPGGQRYSVGQQSLAQLHGQQLCCLDYLTTLQQHTLKHGCTWLLGQSEFST